MLSVRIVNGPDVCEVTDEGGEKFGSDIYDVVDVVKRCLMGLGFAADCVEYFMERKNGES